MTSSVHELMTQIRELVNEPWKHYELRQDNARFSQLVSALDTVEDTEEAIIAFNTEAVENTAGRLYLIIYGLFQALFLQQDATRHLSEALGVHDTFNEYSQLMVVREIRNDSIGHPTKRDRRKGQPTSYHQISRPTMSKQGFQLLSYYSDGSRQFRDISIPDLVADQRKFLAEMLTLVVNALRAERAAHKERFRMEKLSTIFPRTLTYAFEKVGQAIRSDPAEIGRWGLGQIKDTFNAFHDAIGRRDMDAYTSLQSDLKFINHAIAQLERILDARASAKNQIQDELDGHIYLSFLRAQADELREYAQQVDDDYEEESETSPK